MQVSSINNVTFNGKFIKTPELEKLLTVSDNESLKTFNKVIDRMSQVNDGHLYKIICHKSRNPLSYTEFLRFYLNKENTLSESITCLHTADKLVSFCESEQEQFERCSNILKQFLPKLEKEYPKIEYNESKTELVQKILDKLA